MRTKNSGMFIFFFLVAVIVMLVYYNKTSTPKLEDVPLPTGLNPVVAENRDKLIRMAAEKGISIVITEDFRSVEQQDQLYAKGRSVAGKVVTQARGGESFHNYGLAVDFALIAMDGNVIWDMNYDGNGTGKSDWMEVVAIAKQLGFEWGGDWVQFKDYPHFEMNFGLTIADLQRGERPPES